MNLALLSKDIGVLLAGGNWNNGASCGSAARNANNARSNANTNNGCHGVTRIREYCRYSRLDNKAMFGVAKQNT